MDFVTQQNGLKEERARTRNMGFVITLLSLALLISVVGNMLSVGTERTVVVPPNITKSFWVTGKKASADYIEQMGSFVGWLILDVTPASIDWKKDMLLTYVKPDVFGAMKEKQDLEGERLRKLNASTYFLPQQVVVDEPSQTAVLRGRMRTQINGQETTTEEKAYAVQFEYAAGRIHLNSFKEVPYASKTQAAALSSGDHATE